ncbi:MAG: uroporphyrinogen decarboxylase [Ignavibacteria bacterium]|nr:uroporphyrinogen decarboxylase [Ignavibacteria bacterium]
MKHTLLTDTLKGEKRERPPVWFMRQAGRVLPSYLKLREQYSFRQLMHDPELTAEVTLLPVHDLGVDAAILFSDILVIPEALGMKVHFTDKGPRFDSPLKSLKTVGSNLSADSSKLNHIFKAIDIINTKISPECSLIGFCGAPFTTFCYMVEGSSANHEFSNAINLIYQNKKAAIEVLEKITELSIEYAVNQAKHGIAAFQLFETHAGLIPSELYIELILPYVRRIASAVREQNIPVIYFPKGLGLGITHITKNIADYAGIDWQYSISEARKQIDANVGLQGNLDMRLLSIDSKEILIRELEKFKNFGKNNFNWIFNTGHGLSPNNLFNNVKFVVDWVKSTDWGR